MGSFPTLDPDSCEPSLIALKSSLFPKADFFPSRSPGAWRPSRARLACGPTRGRAAGEGVAGEPSRPTCGFRYGRVGGPCRPPVFCLKASPKVKGRETGEFAPLGALSVSGDKKDRGREAPPQVRPPRGDGTQAAGGGGGPRGPALSPPSLASPSDVGRTGHVSFSCGCHTRSLRPLTSGSLDGGGTSPFASSSLPPGAVSGRSQELQLTSRQRECARGQRECARGRGRVLVAGVPRGRLWLTRRCGSRRDQRSHAGAAVHLGGGGGRRPRR